MKVTTNTPDLLILTHRPLALAAMLAGLTLAAAAFAVVLFTRGSDAGVIFVVFALSPPVFAYFFLETRDITLDRAAGSVTLSHRAARGMRVSTHPLPGAARVVVERPGPTAEARAVAEAGAPGVATRAVLVGGPQNIPLAEAYSKGPEAFAVKDAVNTWLDG